jgi:hypothetical protein
MDRKFIPLIGELDQRWASAEEWFSASNTDALAELAEIAQRDDGDAILAETMARDPETATTVRSLFLLAINELAFRSLNGKKS